MLVWNQSLVGGCALLTSRVNYNIFTPLSVLNCSSLVYYSAHRDETLNFLCRIFKKFSIKITKIQVFQVLRLDIFGEKKKALLA